MKCLQELENSSKLSSIRVAFTKLSQREKYYHIKLESLISLLIISSGSHNKFSFKGPCKITKIIVEKNETETEKIVEKINKSKTF